jgi:hypothetical protein
MCPIADTIHLALEAQVSPMMLKAEAWATDHPDAVVEGPTFDWRTKFGRLKGFSAYSHVIMGKGPREGLTVLLGPTRKNHDTGTGWRRLRIHIGSAWLWRARTQGLRVVAAAREVLAMLPGELIETLPAEETIEPRRVDLCIDHWGYDWQLADLERFACRQKGRRVGLGDDFDGQAELGPDGRWVYRAPAGSTFYVGKRGAGNRFLRIYDKIAEAKATGKLPWLEPLWEAAGWDGRQRVFRAEIEHGGDWLRQHGCRTLLDMVGCERELWQHYLGDVRHVDLSSSRLKRCETSLVWQQLGKAVLKEPPGRWRWCPRPVRESTDVPALLSQGAGCLFRAERLLRAARNDDRPGWEVRHRHGLFEMVRRVQAAKARQELEALIDRVLDHDSGVALLEQVDALLDQKATRTA